MRKARRGVDSKKNVPANRNTETVRKSDKEHKRKGNNKKERKGKERISLYQNRGKFELETAEKSKRKGGLWLSDG